MARCLFDLLDELCVSHSPGEVRVTDIDVLRQPVGVGEAHEATGAHHPCHLGDGATGVGHPLQHPLAAHRVEAVVGLVERAGVADGEPNAAPRAGGPRP